MESCGRLPGPRECHVWFVELAGNDASLGACWGCLSADEKERAAQFRVEPPRTAFTLARGILRVLLGRYLATEPDRLRFAYGTRGKPRLAFPDAPLAFNVSHSGRFAAYAFAVGCDPGVDIEEVRPMADQENIVRRFFSAGECAAWLALDAGQRDEAFFRCWSRKEAYIKALGAGLSMHLDGFQVSLRPEEPARLIHVAGDAGAAQRWSLHSLAPAEGYVGALALPERDSGVRIMPRLTADGVWEMARGVAEFPPAAQSG